MAAWFMQKVNWRLSRSIQTGLPFGSPTTVQLLCVCVCACVCFSATDFADNKAKTLALCVVCCERTIIKDSSHIQREGLSRYMPIQKPLIRVYMFELTVFTSTSWVCSVLEESLTKAHSGDICQPLSPCHPPHKMCRRYVTNVQSD